MDRKNLKIGVLLMITAVFSFYLASSHLFQKQSQNLSDETQITVASVLPQEQPKEVLRAVSVSNSKVTPEYQVVSSPYEDVLITVTLLDQNNNYVSGHRVNLIPSSQKGKVSYVSTDVSNDKGQVVFKVNSYAEEAVTYTAYDVDANLPLESRAKIAYLTPETQSVSVNQVPYDYEYAAVGAPSMAVDHFEFQGLPEKIDPNEQVSFTIAAYDSADQPVTNYLGTITFSVKGSNQSFVILPTDYTFTAADLGVHTFSLALSFKQAGTYTIDVNDTADPSVFGSHTFQVGTVVDDTAGQGAAITISSPLSGSYNNPSQVLTGAAGPGANLKIFENEIPMGDITADTNGNFTYTMGVLADGSHSIYVAEVAENGSTIINQSNVVELVIDTTVPEVTNVTLDPSDSVGPSTPVKVQLYAKESLSKAVLDFDNATFNMENINGAYEVTVSSPAATGKYPLNFVVADELGNETKVDGKVFLTVKMGNETTVPDITGLKAEPFDGRVVLTWDVPQTTLTIKNYRVHYGLYADQLANVLDTFTDAPTWYIPGMQNGVQYFFAVTAVDDQGNESAHLSEIVSAVPNPEVIIPPDPCVAAGTCGEENLHELKNEPGKTGPEILWLVALALIGGFLYNEFAKIRSF